MPSKKPAATALRDSAKPAEYYEQCIELIGKQVQQAIDTGPRLLSAASEYSIRAAKAAYSAGEPIARCRKHLLEAVKYWKQYLRKGTGGVVRGIVRVDTFVETFAAASLVGDTEDTVSAFMSVFTGDQSPHWHKAIASAVPSILSGGNLALTDLDVKALAAARQFAAVPALCSAVTENDEQAFANALDTYLIKGWGPVADRAAKGDLKQDYPIYVGKWSLFAAALCGVWGSVPELSKKARGYVPFDLIDSEAAR